MLQLRYDALEEILRRLCGVVVNLPHLGSEKLKFVVIHETRLSLSVGETGLSVGSSFERVRSVSSGRQRSHVRIVPGALALLRSARA